MTAPLDDMPSSEAVWVTDGMRVGASLDDAHLVLVLGDDPRTTALAALGVARAQASHRRVALGDLLGDAEPIHRLLDSDDPHGLTDSFSYGVSLNKIAHPVPQYGDFYVLPSGTEVPSYEDIFTSSRWRRLASGFRETGALLVVAAPADAANVTDVVDHTDGVILVGGANVSGVNGDKLVGRVTPAEAPEEDSAAAGAPNEEAAPGTASGGSWRRRLPIPPAAAAAGAVLAVGLAAIGIWLAARPLARGHEPFWLRRKSSTSAAGTIPSTLDSLRADSGAAAAATLLTPANPADSGNAAAYAVVIARFNTLLGATVWLQTQSRDLPSPTFAPVIIQGETWYRALAGSYPTRGQADSLLTALSAKGLSRADSNNVVRAPFAFLVDSVSADAVPGMLKYFAGRGQPVYALRQSDGSARLYAGAFESPGQANLFVDAVRSGGNIRPVLVYRIGRAF